MDISSSNNSSAGSKSSGGKESLFISVITPAYNAVMYIVDTAESLIKQTYQNWEWLVIDDGSTDGTYEYLCDLQKKDPRIRVLKTSSRCGPAGARTIGFRQAQGDYVCFLDADDLWLCDKLKIQLEFMVKTNIKFSFHSYRRISEDGSRTGRLLRAKSRISFDKLLWYHNIGCLTVMLKRDLIIKEEMQDIAHEDLAFWLKILKNYNIEAFGIDADLARYRVLKKSRSSDKKLAAFNLFKMYREHLKMNFVDSVFNFVKYGFISLVKYRKF